MGIGLLGRKVGMTQVFDASGKALTVTVLQAGPCHVLQLRTLQKDGYEAVQVGYADKPRRLASRSERGHVAKLDSKRARKLGSGGVELPAKAGCEPQKFVREFRIPVEGHSVGQTFSVEVFDKVKSVDVTGISKGRGTSGVIKRHRFSGQRATHGVKKVHRHGGSTGMNSFPAHTFAGKRMAGRYGAEKSTMRNIDLVRVDPENNLLLVRGAVPGPNGGYVVIRETNKL